MLICTDAWSLEVIKRLVQELKEMKELEKVVVGICREKATVIVNLPLAGDVEVNVDTGVVLHIVGKFETIGSKQIC
jgi:hypothetical protein